MESLMCVGIDDELEKGSAAVAKDETRGMVKNDEVLCKDARHERDAFVFRKNPSNTLLSEKKITQVIKILVNKMGWPALKVAKHSGILCYSLEKRTIPRCTVFKVLLSKGLVSEDLSVPSLLHMREGEFLERFVTKYVDQIPQLMSVYQGKVDMNDVENRELVSCN